MSIQAATTDLAVSFQVSASDLGPLFVDRLRTTWNQSSPLAGELGRYVPGSGTLSGEGQKIASHPAFAAVATVVTQPDFRMLHRTGGGAVPFSVFGAYRNKSIGKETLVSVSPSFEGSFLMQSFPTVDAYLDWWVDTIASRIEEVSPNYLPPPMPLESFVYALHAVDAFRRATFTNMLSYAPTGDPFITGREFVESMSAALRSQDIRWLLPTFLFLTPGLDSVSFEPRPEHLALLAEGDFLIPAKHAKTGEDIFLFGEAGKAMGVEFYRSWMLAAGFDTALVTGRGEQVLHRAFVAPTALANHFVRLDFGPQGACTINHQPLTARQLRLMLAEMLAADLSAEATPAENSRGAPAVAAPATPPATSGIAAKVEQAARCPACACEIAPADRFCPSCGTPVPPPQPAAAVHICPSCGAKLNPGVRFCGECGKPTR